MKTRWIMIFLVLVMITLSACGGKTPAGTPSPVPAGGQADQAAQTSTMESQDASSNPVPTPGVYPPPGATQPSSANVLYPSVKDGDEVSWFQMLGMLGNGEVTKIVEMQDLKVKLLLKDGRQLMSEIPNEEELQNYLTNVCGPNCATVVVEKQ